MAQRTVGTKLEVSGEADYKKALSSVNQALGVLGAEMKKTSAEFKGNEDSVTALTKKHDVLERTLLTQQDKVKALRDALQHAAETYGESSSAAMRYQKQLYDAEAEVAKTEHALRETEDALKDTDKAMDDMGGSTNNLATMADALAGKLGIQIPDGAKQALAGFGNFSAGAVVAVGAVGAAVAAVIKITKELSALTVEAAGRADEIMTESMISGLSTDTVQKIQYASELIDVSYSTINGSLTKLTSNMAAAKDGSEKQIEAFARLGVSVTDLDGNLRSAEDVFFDVIDALGNIENTTERDAASMEIFGKSAKELNPIIIQGSDALRAYMEEAEAAGYVMDNDMLEALGNVDDAYQRLQMSQEAVKNELAAEFAPTQEKVFTDMRDFIQKAGGALVDSGLVSSLGSVLQSLSGMLEPLGTLINTILPAIKFLLDPIAGILALIADVADEIVAVFTLDFQKFNTAMGNNAKYGQYSHMQRWMGYGQEKEGNYYDPSTGLYTGNYFTNSIGTLDFQGGWTRVGENGPENVYLPRGTRIDNAQESRLGGGDTYVFGEGAIQIRASDVQEFNDVVGVFKNARVRGRMA